MFAHTSCCTLQSSSVILTCAKCISSHHIECLAKDWTSPPLKCDPLYSLKNCPACLPTLPTQLHRLALSWADVIHISLLNLSNLKEPRRRSPDGSLLYYHVKMDIAPFVEANWNLFWARFVYIFNKKGRNTLLGEVAWHLLYQPGLNSTLELF
jgi:hypothetical protein